LIKLGFVRPLSCIEMGNGFHKFFVRSQLYKLSAFRFLVDGGIERKRAVIWANAFHNRVVDGFQHYGLPKWVIFQIDIKEKMKPKASAKTSKRDFYLNLNDIRLFYDAAPELKLNADAAGDIYAYNFDRFRVEIDHQCNSLDRTRS
jgi:hypothetical protein